jgi:phospholipase C
MHRTLTVTLLAAWFAWTAIAPTAARADDDRNGGPKTTTPIKHLVVIFDENNSFDHYFGTYTFAPNPGGEPQFHPRPDTPVVNGFTPVLVEHNPNVANPFRLDRTQALTCDNDNHYTDEQKAFDGGLLDKFSITSATGAGCTPNLAMGYYDGNTVTALWNYAQNYAMSDNFFDTEFGTTVMGRLNLISGQTHGTTSRDIAGKIVNGSVIANVQPVLDDCPGAAPRITMTGKNVGDLLNAANTTWGWFYGDFGATSIPGGIATCVAEYNSHYDPFQYYASTSNPHHLPPSSVAMIGKTDQANHQYDLTAFWQALANGNLPAVSFLKAPVTQTGHPGDSTPLAEQEFLVNTINALERSPYWRDMAIVIAYDDSDGWYDHVMPPIVSQSNDPANDALLGPAGLCGTPQPGAYLDRCGYGERLPFLAISPFAKRNYVDHSLNDTTSILRFIEDNRGLGRIGDQSFDAFSGTILGMFDFDDHGGDRDKRDADDRRLLLDPTTGERIGW